MAEMADIREGTPVEVTTASGERVRMIATSGPVRGRDFMVIWVAMLDDFERSREVGEDVDALPWPATDVKVA